MHQILNPRHLNYPESPSITLHQSSPIRRRVYKQRWVVIGAYSFSIIVNGFVQNAFGPISLSLQAMLGLRHHHIALLGFYAFASSFFLLIPFIYLLKRLRFRKCLIAMAALVALSSILRCIQTGASGQTFLINISAILSALASTAVYLLPPLLSNAWFPPDEWNTATSIALYSEIVGNIGTFVVGPAMVPEAKNSTFSAAPNLPSGTTTSVANIQQIQEGYFRFTYLQTGLACIALIVILCLVVDSPPSPPSASAEAERAPIMQGLKQLPRMRTFWLIGARILLINGLKHSLNPILSIYLEHKNLTQMQAGWLGFDTGVMTAIVGLIVGRIADRYGHLKMISIVLAFLSFQGAILLFLIGQTDFVPHNSHIIVYCAYLLFACSASASTALILELGCQACYPIHESATSSALLLLYYFLSMCFISTLFQPDIPLDWIDWYLLVSTGLGLTANILMPEKYNRSEAEMLDLASTTEDISDSAAQVNNLLVMRSTTASTNQDIDENNKANDQPIQQGDAQLEPTVDINNQPATTAHSSISTLL